MTTGVKAITAMIRYDPARDPDAVASCVKVGDRIDFDTRYTTPERPTNYVPSTGRVVRKNPKSWTVETFVKDGIGAPRRLLVRVPKSNLMRIR